MAIKQQRSIPWQQLPLLRYGIPFGLGIILSPYLIEISLYLFLFTWLGIAILSRLRYAWSYRWIVGGLIYLLALISGIIVQKINSPCNEDQQINASVGYQGEVIQQKTTSRGTSLNLQGTWAFDTIQQTWLPFQENLWVYIKDSIPDDRQYQTIIFWKPLQTPSRPRSPYAFDFKKYLQDRHIHRIAYLEKGEWLGVVKPQSWRDRQVAQLRKLFREEQYSGLLAALVFGDRRYLPKEIQEQYAQAGAIHVLAVSGLHVGMVLVFLQLIFRVVPGLQGAKGKKYAIPLQIMGIWSYASMTGWSPSVCRASIMLSLLLIARASRRNTIGINSLAGAALILLAYHDEWIFNIGFQFSCLAVLGILLFQKPIFRIWNSKYRLVRWFWELSSVSLAAQLTTFPLGLYYFHQFPVWFLLSGSMVVPLAPILIGGTVLILLLDWTAICSPSYLVYLLEWILQALNSSMAWMASHSPAWQSQFSLSSAGIWYCYLSITAVAFWSLAKEKKPLFICLAMSWIIQVGNMQQTSDYEQLQVLKAKAEIILHYRMDDVLFTWKSNKGKLPNMEQFYRKQGVQSFHYNLLPNEPAALTTNHKETILWIPNGQQLPALNQPADYLIIAEPQKINPSWATPRVCPDGIVFITDYLWKKDLSQWQRMAADNQFKIWYLPKKGAYY